MEWPQVPLATVAKEFISGGTPSTKVERYWTGDIPWITGADVTDKVVASGRKWITREAVENSATHVVPQGAVLLVTRTGVGKVAKAGVDIAISQDLTGIVLKDGIIADFIVAAIQHKVSSLQHIQQGAIIKGVLRKDIETLEIPLPPPSEQRRIVEILDQADRLRRLRAEADAKADRILPALFIKMFGDPATNPMGWPVESLGDLSVLGPQYGANARSVPLSPGQPRYVRITDIREGGRLAEGSVGIDLADWGPYKLEEGDLLFARSGATVGKTYIHRPGNGPCAFAGYLIRFRLDATRLHPLVAFAFTQTSAYRAWVDSKRRTAAQPNINGQEYASLRVPVPARSLQERFVSLYSMIELVGRASSVSSRRLECLFSGLLRRAFSGDLTASWREPRMKELLQEMEQQARALTTG
jgi:type I restriction enzyme S subunit